MKKLTVSLAGLVLAASASQAQLDFTLQVIHASDLEGGVEAIVRAPNFAAIIQHLEEANPAGADGTVILSAGDNVIPGPFFNAASDGSVRPALRAFYNAYYGTVNSTVREDLGRIDMAIMNAIGFDASALGNHEFDSGTEVLRGYVHHAFRNAGDIRHTGAQFPYLSANLDFSGDANLAPIFTADILPNTDFAVTPQQLVDGLRPPSIAQATTIVSGGKTIGVIGATTQRLPIISSPGGVAVAGGVSDNVMTLLAAQLQPVINNVIAGPDGIMGTADDVLHIVLVTHLQQISLEETLAGLLTGVDIIIAGGSDALLANAGNTLLPGDTAADQYPVIVNSFDGKPTLIVSTAGEYSYVGQLVVPFDANGEFFDVSGNGTFGLEDLDLDDNGPIAATLDTVEDLWGDLVTPFAAMTRGKLVQDLVNSVTGVVTAKDGQLFGYSAVFLEGNRAAVRTEETNMGNLTADANLWQAQSIDPSVVISFKNGGGIRAQIGSVDGLTGVKGTTLANPTAAKPAGAISQLDIENTLRFNNGLVTFELSGADLLTILTHGVAASFGGNTQGRYPQIGGLQFSYIPAVDGNNDGDLNDPEDSAAVVRSFALVDLDGKVTRVLYKDGAFVGTAATDEFRVVSLNFLAGLTNPAAFTNFGTSAAPAAGGDGYPFPPLGQNPQDLFTGEQTALQQYLQAFYGTPADAFSIDDLDVVQDSRIQNLEFRFDTVGVNYPVPAPGALRMTAVATFASGIYDDSAAEIVDFDPDTLQLFAISSAGAVVRIIDASTPLADAPAVTSLPEIGTIAAPFANLIPNSVAVFSIVDGDTTNDLVAIAWADDAADNNDLIVDRGVVTLHQTDGTLIGTPIIVGFHPDALTFTPDGSKIVVANEGEPRVLKDANNDDIVTDNPVGSVSVISVVDPLNPVHTEITFDRWNNRASLLLARGVLLTQLTDPNVTVAQGKATTVAQDLEPEYVAVSEDSRYAWVSLQENNALAKIDLLRNAIVSIDALGTVDYMANPIDASDRDGPSNSPRLNVQPRPIFGLRQPDTIAVKTINGVPYIFTADEGDARGFEESRIRDLGASEYAPTGVISREPNLRNNSVAGRYTFNRAASPKDGSGRIEEIFGYGGRSMSIFAAPNGGRFRYVGGSEGDLEAFTASLFSTAHNSNHRSNDSRDTRSDDKGVEPEALELADVFGKTYAFIGLERQSGIVVYDVTNPTDIRFQTYATNRFFTDDNDVVIATNLGGGVANPAAGDLGPESIKFIPAAVSPVPGVPMIAVSNEVSGTVTLWKLESGL